MGFKLLPLVAVALLGVGNLLHIIGLATPEWVRREETRHSVKVEYTSGLWEFCTNDECDSIDNEPDTMTDRLEACRAMAILGMLAGVAAVVIVTVYFVMCLMGKEPLKLLGLGSFVAAALAFIFILISVLVYGVEARDDNSDVGFGYSFGLCISGAIFIMIGGGTACAGSQ